MSEPKGSGYRDAHAVADACQAVDLSTPLGDEYRYGHLSLCVLDAVYSIGVRYQATAAVVRRYAAWASLNRCRATDPLPPPSAQQPLEAFVAHVAGMGPQHFAEEIVTNRQ